MVGSVISTACWYIDIVEESKSFLGNLVVRLKNVVYLFLFSWMNSILIALACGSSFNSIEVDDKVNIRGEAAQCCSSLRAFLFSSSAI